MKKQTTLLLLTLAWMVPIRAHAVQLGADVVSDKVRAFVMTQLAAYVKPGAGGSQVTVDVPSIPSAPFDFPDTEKVSDIRFELQSPLTIEYTDSLAVRVSMVTPDGARRDIGVPVKITISKPVYVIKQMVTAGAHLKTSDFELQRRDVSQDLQHVAGPELAMGNYIARVNLIPGQLLDTRRLQIPPDISRYDEVTLILTNGSGMTISVKAVALANANIGDTVRVRHGEAGSRKYYTATVVSKNCVEVQI